MDVGASFMTPEADDNRLAEEHRPNNGLDKSSPYYIKIYCGK